MDALLAYLQQGSQASDQRFGAKKPGDQEVYSTVNGSRLQTYTAADQEE
jgi:hypothetical protein